MVYSENSSIDLNKACDFLFIDISSDFEIQLEEKELQVVYYVAGYYIVKSLISCVDCRNLLLDDHNMPLSDDQFFVIVKCGGLPCPSNQLWIILPIEASCRF